MRLTLGIGHKLQRIDSFSGATFNADNTLIISEFEDSFASAFLTIVTLASAGFVSLPPTLQIISEMTCRP